ncbi:MAG: hypothetical protein F4205_04920 [Gemmatimonadetes bacterium]|nr:hypothetical protein [Gemmatimonadota bacterium]MYG34814.1 hypothetical protein [Gemmatimonadota bacterium]
MRPVNTAIPHLPRLFPLAALTALFVAAAHLFSPVPAATQSPEADAGLSTITDYTLGMDAQPGFFPLYWDDAGGRLLVEVGRWDEQFLYLTSLATGVGSNALGLDRGNIESAYLAHFERVGPKVLLVLDNPGFRAETDPTEALVRSVDESFPTSTVGGFAVVAEENGRALVDATSFDGEEFVMMRRRQHSAHEIGHTLGLAHNFISISDGHASVMDYPAPVIELRDGRLDLSGAYRAGPGAYDTLAIRYAYASPPAGESEEDFLNGLLLEAQERGWRFISNPDAGADNSYPDATWWINGSDVLDEFERVSEVRRFMIDSFDERAIEPGEPMHKLRERFAPVYFSHRATYEAAIKTIGGMEYTYGVRGDILPVTELVSADRVRRAMDLLSEALAPGQLAIPESVLQILAPRSFGWVTGGPAWSNRAGPAFDQIGAATTVASEIVGGVLAPSRTARVVAFHARDPVLPSLEEVVGRLVDDAWGREAGPSDEALVRVVQNVVVDELLALAADGNATTEARAAAEWGLRRALARAGDLASEAGPGGEVNSATQIAHAARVVSAINRFFERPWQAGERTDAPQGPGWARDPGGHR